MCKVRGGKSQDLSSAPETFLLSFVLSLFGLENDLSRRFDVRDPLHIQQVRYRLISRQIYRLHTNTRTWEIV